ncbi:MAG: sigma-54-dependent Fis family transcriptional regulator [Phycisphaerales bacterium]|nr:MAG: sigma-54-dependent Fis family transcriptional regulator [Phycisphaerales bacterium]
MSLRIAPPKGSAGRVLIVDDDPIVADSLAEFLSSDGFDCATAGNAGEAIAMLQRANEDADAAPFDVVLCDISLPGESGIELLRDIRRKRLGCAVVMLTGYGTIESAVESLRLGASDYLVKPIVDAEIRSSLDRALQQRALLAENRTLRTRLEGRLSASEVIGSDHRMARIFELVEAVAPSKTTVLMCGESGTGKSLIAHAIHQRSPRHDKPYVELSCGSIPETLLESELFGHSKGAFTGAHADKVGRFLAANTGTIFLDEINSASPAMQLKLLRVLQERRFEPVGSTQTIEVDVRVILASNQPLEQLVAEGRFRQDLYYRINVVPIELPPLRDRVSDIPLLAERFLHKHSADLGRQVVGFTPDAMKALMAYRYPGNVRELQNIIERAAVLAKGQTITPADLPEQMVHPDAAPTHAVHSPGTDDADVPWEPMTLDAALREPERRILLKALRANHWNRQKTAEQLGINRTTLYKKLKALDIEPTEDDIRDAG